MESYLCDFSVCTLGQFMVKRGSKVLISDLDGFNKQWKLFLYLLFNREKIVFQQELINHLDLDSNQYPRQSLRVLVYRLRKKLNKGVQNSKPVIKTRRRGYELNSDFEYWVDCLEFVRLIKKGEGLSVEEEKIEIYQKALEIYRAPLLNSHNVDPWLLAKRNKFHDFYLETVQKCTKILINLQKYQEAIDIYETALMIYPYEVDFHLELFNVLKKAGRENLAHNRAEESILFLEEAKLQVPDRLKKQAYEVRKINYSGKSVDILKKNGPAKKEIFECGPLTFSYIYKLEKRRSRRNNKKIYLVHCKLRGDSLPRNNRKAEKVLEKIFYTNLRQADILTRLQPAHYLNLFVNIHLKEVKKIIQRLQKKFQKNCDLSEIELEWEIEEI